ncbi:ferrochelatase [bacterium]|nr:MAG: ferrochelatase [bacterium]
MKTGIFLLNMGGPDSIEAIAPFLYNLFSDPEILKFPLSRWLQRPLASAISKRRAKKVAAQYEAMGGKSPLPGITAAQAKALAEKLGEDYEVFVTMRYWHPRAEEAVRRAKEAGIGRVVVLPLYPHYCRATTGTSIADLEEALEKGGLGGLPKTVIRSWQDFPPYLDALAESLREAMEGAGETTILFSAHSVPVSVIEGGDPYLDHIKATVAGVMERFPGKKHLLAFQSRAGPVKWLAPSMEEALRSLAKEGVKDVTVVAVSFVSDHIETLREIDVEYRELAHSLGITGFRRAPSLNVRPDFISALELLARGA